MNRPIPLPAWVEYLFLEFVVIYKEKWTKPFINDAIIYASKLRWVKVLEGIEERFIKETIDEVAKKFDWPPSYSKFFQIAKATQSRFEEKRKHEERQKQQATFFARRNPEKARIALSEIMKNLRRHVGKR